MNNTDPQPIFRGEDNELLGYIMPNNMAWVCATIFGYVFATAPTEEEAKKIVLDKGLQVLMGTWEYLDQESNEWLPCIIIEVAQDSVRIAPMDGIYPDTSKAKQLTGPLNKILRKS